MLEYINQSSYNNNDMFFYDMMEFIRVFEEEAKKIGAVDFLVQGTIYPDVIESGLGKSAVIKSHHNVGGLPDYVDFKKIVNTAPCIKVSRNTYYSSAALAFFI